MPRKRKVTTPEVIEPPRKIRKIMKLQKEKSECDRVRELLGSTGWTIAQQLLDKMIMDTIGGIGQDGMWTAGIVGQANTKGYSTDYLLGYRMSLMDFNNRLKQKAVTAKKIEAQIKDLKVEKPTMSGSWSYMPQTGTL